MLKLPSLTTKFIFISIIMLIFIALYITAGYIFTHEMEGEARRINLSGRERMLTFNMALSIKTLIMSAPPFQGEIFKRRAEMIMAQYEEALYGLRDGSERLGLKPMPKDNQESISQINTLIEMWHNTLKPTLLNIMELPPERKNETCVRCHSAIRENVGKLEIFAKSLEEH